MTSETANQIKQTHSIFVDKLKRTFPEVIKISDSFSPNKTDRSWSRKYRVEVSNIDPIDLQLEVTDNDPYVWKGMIQGSIQLCSCELNFQSVYQIIDLIDQFVSNHTIGYIEQSTIGSQISSSFCLPSLISNLRFKDYFVKQISDTVYNISTGSKDPFHFIVQILDQAVTISLVFDQPTFHIKPTRDNIERIVDKLIKLKSTTPTRFKSFLHQQTIK